MTDVRSAPPRWLLVGDPVDPIAAIPTRAWLDHAWEHGEELDQGILLTPRIWTSPKLAGVGPEALWVLLAGLGYSAHFGLDGRVPKASLHCLTFGDDPEEAVRELVDAGLWMDDGDHYGLAEVQKADTLPADSDEAEPVMVYL